MFGQERKSGLKTREAKGGKEEHGDEQAEFGLGEGVAPLGEFGARGQLGGVRLAAFAQNQPAHHTSAGAKRGGDPAGSLFAEQFSAKRADGWPENESEAE